MISLLSVTFNSEIPARNSNISQGLFYIRVIISTFEIQNFELFSVCSFSPFFFSFVCSTHFYHKKRKGKCGKKVSWVLVQVHFTSYCRIQFRKCADCSNIHVKGLGQWYFAIFRCPILWHHTDKTIENILLFAVFILF